MLVIRREQMAVFQIAQREQFEDSMTAHLAERFAGRPPATDKNGLRTLVREGIKVAAEYGIVAPYDVQRFLELRAEYGPDFHAAPWAAKILQDKTLSGCGKIEQLDDYTLFALRS